ncbi:uncharacterized protein PHACADRAFT_176428 [Phanerochaete carnosa HHB-10118-sp]|uniref:Yeast cell wall synthesis Kre9/Knh1-like N-terminal domain-containing protein n=1 Tax=Phanerochaete carnosa (strain HHB-10118-sp) TaxID=650164 RepID=K5W009_PHACS|nr:uncharacterized protein PHACADRAFT_176428 [Phanerochaete carnosa HHB-10118-sp]EKM52415.1 hypothetical protein PHACADRAFT_176428 [Phanerochaete carnosa HHB-10118-sp]
MRFVTVAAVLAALPTALGTTTITGPSPSSYWVQNMSNTITWTFAQGDPSPVNIVIVNVDNATLNGPFSIASDVDLSNSSFTATAVTLVTGSGYQVEFVSPLNVTQVLATSQSFQVMPPGTAPAPTSSAPSAAASTTGSSTASGSGSGSGSASASGASSSGSASGSGSPSPSPSPGGASALGVSSVFGMLAACGAAAALL